MENRKENEVWERVKQLRDEGKLPPEPTQEELYDEPTALANSQYRLEEGPYIYESPNKGKTVYKRKFREYPIEREKIK